MRKAIFLIPCTLLIAGCFSSNILVTVRPDGSGTVSYTTVYRPSAMAQFEALLPPDPDARPRLPDVVIAGDPTRLALQAFGQFVRRVSVQPFQSNDSMGATSTFSFADVSTLAVELLPQAPISLHGFLPAVRATANTRLTMSLAPTEGGNQLLTIRFPRFRLDPSAEPPGAWATGTAEEMSKLRSVFKDARVTIIVQTETPLLRTNSPHHMDNRVVLFDMEAQKALFSRQIDMLRATPASFDELLSMFGDLPGVTLAPDHVVTIEFSGEPQSAPPPTPAAAPPPPADTEVFLAPLSREGGKLTVGAPVNISNSPGYDNQPCFLPDGRGILFSSGRGPATPAAGERGGTAAAPQTDIYRYDIASKQIARTTNTAESEYSPTVTPDGTRFSVVRVEADGTQRLWSFALSGGNPALVLSEIKPVGYHAWIDDHTLALFVLGGTGKPATLQVADTRTGTAQVISEDIGRAMQRMPSGQVSFVQREPRAGEAPALSIKQLVSAKEPDGRSTWKAELVQPMPGAVDLYHAWMPDGTLLLAQGSTLYAWRTGDAGWRAVADLGAFGLSAVSRLAVAPKGEYLALVAQRQ